MGTPPALEDIPLANTNTFTSATIDGTSTKVLSFSQGNGVKLSPTTGVVPNGGTYTIVVLFKFDSVDGFRRIIDFKNGTSDNGLYVHNGNLEFFRGSLLNPNPAGTGAPIAANTYVQVVLTRDASTRIVTGYVDGTQQFSFSDNRALSDAANDAVIDSNNTLRFFRDNEGGTEHSSGSVARIRLYDRALTATEVSALDRLGRTTIVVDRTDDTPVNSIPVTGACTDAPNDCSLRWAIEIANSNGQFDTISFASGISGTIVLTQGVLSIANDTADPDLIINGPGASELAVSGNHSSGVFKINSGAVAAISGLTIKDSFGSGIFNDGGTVTLNNSTVSGNTANGSFGGGGIYTYSGGTLTLSNSTISGNKAPNSVVGGIYNDANRFALPNDPISDTHTILRNTIVAGNTAPKVPDAGGTFDSQGYNLLGNISGSTGWVASDLLNRDPLLGPLQNNGGPTNTQAPWPGSPAIDSGNPAQTGTGGLSCLAKDQRGVKRPKDGDNTGTSICDIGAYERNDLTSPQVSSTTPISGATGVSPDADLTATFSEQMTSSTLNKKAFKLFKVNSDGSTTRVTDVTVSSSADGLNVTLNPFGTTSTLLEANTKYRAILTTGARDLAGNQLDQDPTLAGKQQKAWTFTTGST